MSNMSSSPALTPEQWQARDYRQVARELDSWAKTQGGTAEDDATEYVAKLGANRGKLASFNSTIYGPQDDCDWQWFPQACNGMHNGQPILGNNPLDANVLNSSTLQGGMVARLVSQFGFARVLR